MLYSIFYAYIHSIFQIVYIYTLSIWRILIYFIGGKLVGINKQYIRATFKLLQRNVLIALEYNLHTHNNDN